MAQDKITFTPELQEKVNELMDKAFSKGLRKGAAEVTELRARVAELENRGPLSFLKKRR